MIRASASSGCVLLLAVAWAAPAQAQSSATSSTATTDEERAREADMFGAPDDAAGDPEAAREADMFGGDDDAAAPASSSTVAPSRDERILDGGGSGAIDRLTAAAEAKDDFLDIGGSLWLWGQWSAAREGALKTFPLSSPSFLDVYLDARPNERVRAFTKFRMNYDFTVGADDVDLFGQPVETPTFALDQLWVKFDVLRTVFVTVGKERVRWGSGRIWNPTDFLNPDPVDPLAFFDVRLGVPLVKLHLPVESLGWNFYLIALPDGAGRLDEVGGAARAEIVLGPAELALSARLRKDEPARFGVDLTGAVWWFDLKAELGLRYRDKRRYYDGQLAIVLSELQNTVLPEPVEREDDLIPQLVLGAEIQIPYSDRDNVTISAEYFYNDVAFDDPSLYVVPLVPLFAPALTPFLVDDDLRRRAAPVLNGNSAVPFNPLFLSRHYAALSVILFGPGDWDDTTFVLNTIVNLSDKTLTARFNYTVGLLTYLNLNAFAQVLAGPSGGSFAFDGSTIPGFRLSPTLLILGASLNLAI